MAKELCEATCPNPRGGIDFVCEREKGHKGKHDSVSGGMTWTDGGAERLREERRKAIEAEPF